MCCLSCLLLVLGPVLTSVDKPNPTDTVVHQRVWAQVERSSEPIAVWVFLTDKGIKSLADYQRATALAKAGLHPRTLHRRKLRGSRGGRVGYDDIAVNLAHVERIQTSGAEIRVRSKWLNAVSVNATGQQIRQIASLPFVRSIEPVRQGRRTDVVPIESTNAIPLGKRRARGGE